MFPDEYGFDLDNFPQMPLRRTYDYELEVILSDGGYMTLGNDKLALKRGAVIFRHPGCKTQALDPFRCYSVIIDMTGKSGKNRDTYIHKAQQQVQTDYQNQILNGIRPITYSEDSEKLIHLFTKIYKEYKANWPHTTIILRSYVLEILYILYADAISQQIPVLNHPKQYHKAVHKATEFINSNYAKKLTLPDIADYIDLSANYFSRLFTQCMGVSLSTYIINIRLQKAKELIIYTNLSIGQIANLCGFDSQAYFISMFHRQFLMTPGKFRNTYK
jgi:AraC-like DNA-binding protein